MSAVTNTMMSTVTSRQVAPAWLGTAPHYLARIAGLEGELVGRRLTEARLRAALKREALLIREKNNLIAQQILLGQESDHRMLNDLQMIVSLLSLQSRKTTSEEAALQLAMAASRVATIERVHRRLHCLDGKKTVAFRPYLEDFCNEFSSLLSSNDGADRRSKVEAVDAEIPTATAIPLGFIVNELLTNAAKHGQGDLAVRLQHDPRKTYALSISNDGPALPEAFDPASSKGLGMRIVRAFVGQIGGELHCGRSDGGQGARFTVVF